MGLSSLIQHTDKPPKADRDFLLKALKKDGQLLKRAAKTLQADREVVLVAVKAFGRALQYAAEPLQADREIVLEAPPFGLSWIGDCLAPSNHRRCGL